MDFKLYLYDHESPSNEHKRLIYFNEIISKLDIPELTLRILSSQENMKLKVGNSNCPTLIFVHQSEYQFQRLEQLLFNPYVYFIFYSGSGFKDIVFQSSIWSDHIFFLQPSIDFLNEELSSILTSTIKNCTHLKKGVTFRDILSQPQDCYLLDKITPLITPPQNTDQRIQDLFSLHHNLKEILFIIKKNEQTTQLYSEVYPLWKQKYKPLLLELNDTIEIHQTCETFDKWLKTINTSKPSNHTEETKGIKILISLREKIHAIATQNKFQTKIDFSRSGKKTEIWIANFSSHDDLLCKSILSRYKEAPYVHRQIGPRNHLNNYYTSYNQLIEDLRDQPPEKLADTYLLLICDGSIELLLNCGHQRQSSSLDSWKMDDHSHLGLLAQIALEFPQLNSHVLCKNETYSFQEKVFTQELSPCIPKGISHKEVILEQAFKHHFFIDETQNKNLHFSILSFLQGNRYLYDPTGLRTLIKLKLISNVFAGIDKYGHSDLENTSKQREVLSTRLENISISIDEDINSANFHAYASYRYGWRSWTATTFKEFDQPHLWNTEAINKLVIRDTDLRFPDINSREPYRNSKGKTNVRFRLECIHSDLWNYLPIQTGYQEKLGSEWKVRVITADANNVKTKRSELTEIEQLKGESTSKDRIEFSPLNNEPLHQSPKYLGISKPFNSFYDISHLWDKSQKTIAARLFPPERLHDKTGHFAPYVNLPIAEQLLKQVKRLDNNQDSSFILGSILATEADELLLGMSEYSGLEAIQSLHRTEVMAEIKSIGFSGHININDRRQEINELVKVRYKNDSAKQDQFLHRFWDDLRTLYKSSEQFRASEQSNIESFSKRKWIQAPILPGKLEETFRKGLILCASSLNAWIAFWVFSNLLFSLLYLVFLEHPLDMTISNFFFQVYISSLIGEPSFGLETSLGSNPSLSIKSIIFMHFGCSYILFGFFLSMIYRKITRS